MKLKAEGSEIKAQCHITHRLTGRGLRHLLQACETLVGMRTELKNMGHAALTRSGVALSRSAFATAVGRELALRRQELSATDHLILEAAVRQIKELDSEIKGLEEEIVRVGKTLRGLKRVLQLHGLNLLSAISLHTGEDDP